MHAGFWDLIVPSQKILRNFFFSELFLLNFNFFIFYIGFSIFFSRLEKCKKCLYFGKTILRTIFLPFKLIKPINTHKKQTMYTMEGIQFFLPFFA